MEFQVSGQFSFDEATGLLKKIGKIHGAQLEHIMIGLDADVLNAQRC